MLNSTYSGLTLLGIPQNAYEWVAGQTTNQKLRKLRKLYGDKLVQLEEGLFLLLQREVFINQDGNSTNIANVEAIRVAAKPYLDALDKGCNIIISIPAYTPEKMKLSFEGSVDKALEDRSIKLLRSKGIPDDYYKHEGQVPITFTKHRHGFVGLIKIDLLKSYGIDFKPYQADVSAKTIITTEIETEIKPHKSDLLINSSRIESEDSLKYANLPEKKPMVTSSNLSNSESLVSLKKEINLSQQETMTASNSTKSKRLSKSVDEQLFRKIEAMKKSRLVKSKKGKRSRRVAIGWLMATLIFVAVAWVWSPQNNSLSRKTVLTYKHIVSSFKPSSLELVNSSPSVDQDSVWEPVKQNFNATMLSLKLLESNRISTPNISWTPIKRDFKGTAMVLVPTGSFNMGSSTKQIDSALALCSEVRLGRSCERLWYEDEEPTNEQHFTNPFWLDETEVTRGAYDSCVSASVCTPTPSNKLSTTADQPINQVTWYQAAEYCKWREARLPTEAEWEYAARGPDGLKYPWGNTMVGSEANHCDGNCANSDWGKGLAYTNSDHNDNFAETAPVGSYPNGASWVGALDMSGNVWEWTNSLYKEYPYSKVDGRELNKSDNEISEKVVLRGGSFTDYSDSVRAADRYWAIPSISFRLWWFSLCPFSRIRLS